MLAKITAKSKKKNQNNRQRRMFQISNLSVPKCFCQNEVLSAWFKFQVKIPTCSGVRRESDKNTPVPPTPLSKDEGLKDIRHSMSIRNQFLVVNSVTVSYLTRYDSLLQNGTDIITKCDSYFITKCVRFFITKCDSLITKCDSFNKLRQLYYKMRGLLQIVTAHWSGITRTSFCVFHKFSNYLVQLTGFPVN